MKVDSKANQQSGVSIPGGRHVSEEGARQNAAFFAYRAKQRQAELDRLAIEAAERTLEEARIAASRAATKAAFYGG